MIPRIPVPGILSLLDSESLTVILLSLDLVLLQIILGNADTPNSSWKFDHLYVSKLEGQKLYLTSERIVLTVI